MGRGAAQVARRVFRRAELLGAEWTRMSVVTVVGQGAGSSRAGSLAQWRYGEAGRAGRGSSSSPATHHITLHCRLQCCGYRNIRRNSAQATGNR